MFGYDRINERYLLENTNRYEMPEWAKAEQLHNCEGFMTTVIKFFRSAL